MHWRRKWQPTPVFLPGESQGWRSLVGCRLWVAESQTRLKRFSSSRLTVVIKNNAKTESLCCTSETSVTLDVNYTSRKKKIPTHVGKWKWSCSVVSDSLQPHAVDVVHQAPRPMGFSRHGYWSGLSFPSPRDLPDPGIEPRSPVL